MKNFFKEVDQRLSFPIQVILTGGAAAAFFGVDRVTYDIDFEVHIKTKKGKPPANEEKLAATLLVGMVVGRSGILIRQGLSR